MSEACVKCLTSAWVLEVDAPITYFPIHRAEKIKCVNANCAQLSSSFHSNFNKIAIPMTLMMRMARKGERLDK